jgi:ribosome-associated protein
MSPGVALSPAAVTIEGECIPLGSFLKWAHAAESGGEAKHAVQAGQVRVNGIVEVRRRHMLRPGDVVVLSDGRAFRVVRADGHGR